MIARYILPIFLLAAPPLHGAIVWELGEPGILAVNFEKDAFANPFLAPNQDIISPTVTLTRADLRGMFNFAAPEFSYVTNTSPLGTEWAFSGLNGNPTGGNFSASNFANLNFTSWEQALEGPPNLADNIRGRDGVLHLLAEDVYLEIQFNDWGIGQQGGGSFSYIRASGSFVPEPGSALLLGLAALSFLRRRR